MHLPGPGGCLGSIFASPPAAIAQRYRKSINIRPRIAARRTPDTPPLSMRPADIQTEIEEGLSRGSPALFCEPLLPDTKGRLCLDWERYLPYVPSEVGSQFVRCN